MHFSKNKEKIGGFFWLCFGLFVMVESYRLSLGTLRKPGEGLLPFLGGAGVALLSIILLISPSIRASIKTVEKELPTRYANLLIVLLGLLVYVLLLEWLGFLISTFLLMGFFLRAIEPKKWWVLFLTSFISSLLAWVVFKVWLGIQLPMGILPF